MVSVLVFTVAPFQWRHNARRTTSEWLLRSSILEIFSVLSTAERPSFAKRASPQNVIERPWRDGDLAATEGDHALILEAENGPNFKL
jgi:hypothetical protein